MLYIFIEVVIISLQLLHICQVIIGQYQLDQKILIDIYHWNALLSPTHNQYVIGLHMTITILVKRWCQGATLVLIN